MNEPIEQSTPDKIAEIICRLCARTILDIGQHSKSIEDVTIISALQKCFPTLRIDANDELFLPRKICPDCCSILNQFTEFVDRVIFAQNDLHQKFGASTPSEFGGSYHDDSISNIPEIKIPYKTVANIKQEPIFKVKQEIVDNNRNCAITEDFNRYPNDHNHLFPENDAFCEFCDAYFINNLELKNHILKYHSDATHEVPNNCEIMEIITLENAFIDLAENCIEGEDDNEPQHHTQQNQEHETYMQQYNSGQYVPLDQVLKVEHFSDYEQREQLFLLNTIHMEHNYSNSCEDTELQTPATITVLKQEPIVLQSLQPLKIFESSHINEQYAETVATKISLSKLYDCTKCTAQFDSQTNLAAHQTELHYPHMKQCSICMVEFKNIYQYLMHKTKCLGTRYHSGSKKLAITLKCSDCLVAFASKLALNNHKRYICPNRRGLSYHCRYCKVAFAKWISMRHHVKKCSRRFPDIVHQEIEISSVEEITKINQPNIKVEEKKQRQKLRLKLLENGNLSIKETENGRFACHLCSRTYSRRSNLVR